MADTGNSPGVAMAKSISSKIGFYWRLASTGLAFVIFGIGGVIIPSIAGPVIYLSIRDEKHRQRVARRLVQWSFRAFVWLLQALGVMRCRVSNEDRLKRRGQIILANHPTLIDIVLLVALIPNATCIVKSKLLKNPAMRGFIQLTGYISNSRSEGLIENIGTALDDGCNVIVFPEGTRTTPGEPVRFQRGAANLSIRNQRDVTPVLIRCDPATLSKEHRWYQIPDRAFDMHFYVLDDLAVNDYLAVPPSLAARQLTRDLENYFNQARLNYDNNTCTGTEILDY